MSDEKRQAELELNSANWRVTIERHALFVAQRDYDRSVARQAVAQAAYDKFD